jgi:hypothetical protein
VHPLRKVRGAEIEVGIVAQHLREEQGTVEQDVARLVVEPRIDHSQVGERVAQLGAVAAGHSEQRSPIQVADRLGHGSGRSEVEQHDVAARSIEQVVPRIGIGLHETEIEELGE